jgi:hypothetical protein
MVEKTRVQRKDVAPGETRPRSVRENRRLIAEFTALTERCVSNYLKDFRSVVELINLGLWDIAALQKVRVLDNRFRRQIKEMHLCDVICLSTLQTLNHRSFKRHTGEICCHLNESLVFLIFRAKLTTNSSQNRPDNDERNSPFSQREL